MRLLLILPILAALNSISTDKPRAPRKTDLLPARRMPLPPN